MDSVELWTLAENLGSVESLITHPVTMTHAAIETGGTAQGRHHRRPRPPLGRPRRRRGPHRGSEPGPRPDMSDDSILAAFAGLGSSTRLCPVTRHLADTAEFCAAYGIDLADSANTILVVGKSNPRVYVACVVLADTRLDVNGMVRKRLGIRRTSFASAEETGARHGDDHGRCHPIWPARGSACLG